MNSPVTCSYTPPPPGKPSDTSGSALKAIDHPIAATPLPPAPSIAGPPSSSSSTAVTGQSNPQIRYCYFISAASATNSRSRNPSISRKTIYLTPQAQESMEASPNCPQPRPRSRPSKDNNSSNAFVLGPHPPQIQLQFLEDEPLPPVTSTEPSTLVDSMASDKLETSDGVLVERKDSGYGGSVSRSSSLAAFGRGIRKVFWRTTSKGSVESVVMTDPPVLDCDIPQDVLDHEDWAQDLAQRLTIAAAPDVVTAWLGQLPYESSTLPESTSSTQEASAVFVNMSEGSGSSESFVVDIVEEIVFMVPFSAARETSIEPMATPTNVSTPVASSIVEQQPPEKILRSVLSMEHLNKPQPPLPANSIGNKPIPSTPMEAKRATSPFSSISKKLTIAADFGFGKSQGKSAPQSNPRRTVQHHFQESTSEAALSASNVVQAKEMRLSSQSIERLLDASSMDSPLPMVTSPEELEGPSYVTVKPASKRTRRFFMSLTPSSVADFKRENEERHQSEVLLSQSNLSPEEISAEVLAASQHGSPQWKQQSAASTPCNGKERSASMSSLVPPTPLFYNRGRVSSASSLGEMSSCGSVDSSPVDSSADEWDGLDQMAHHAQEQNARYKADLKDLQTLLYQSGGFRRSMDTPSHSANTSTGSLSLPSASSTPSKKESKASKIMLKKDDYMSHRMSACSPKLLPVVGKAKTKSKSRLSTTIGGGELEVVKPAKFDTPEAIARNKEIRKFISQEIYTTELNYLQYLRTVQELLAHVSSLIAVSSQVTRRLEDCVRDEVWSDELTMVGTIFLDVKEPLTIFLRYGQSYGKGMKALRTLMKSKRASVSIASPVAPSLTLSPSGPRSSLLAPDGPRMDKRRSLPSIFSLNSSNGAPSSAHLDSSWSGSSGGSRSATASPQTDSKPKSNHGTLTVNRNVPEQERFLQNCAGGKETTSRFSLADLLILPIQRVTRYCLLLKDLKRHTDTAHPDYVCLVHALEQVHTLALATNNVQPSSMRS
ncbi:Rho guanine nucleotide exchange factor (GEF) 17 [Mortierella polycephala]|uniref:Rho guanine nucleotide exchange factor (GEF) 17 n=1 Tax=Mortierella polycephala TaxID=41804 RepID=A0A9P6QHW0_9FUNG|nr:Rho guanine nucleotide exchange factor (GEF) 17 [Mortierella polycephala]